MTGLASFFDTLVLTASILLVLISCLFPFFKKQVVAHNQLLFSQTYDRLCHAVLRNFLLSVMRTIAEFLWCTAWEEKAQLAEKRTEENSDRLLAQFFSVRHLDS